MASKIDEKKLSPDFCLSISEEQISISWIQLPAEEKLKNFLYGLAIT
jgi:hypothetical protein